MLAPRGQRARRPVQPVPESTPAYLIPLLHLDRGVPLAQAGLLAAAPSLGMVMALVAWGAVTDRYGERWVIAAAGLALTAAFAFAAAAASGYVGLGVLFVLGGAPRPAPAPPPAGS